MKLPLQLRIPLKSKTIEQQATEETEARVDDSLKSGYFLSIVLPTTLVSSLLAPLPL
jgi:hypothetical protein